MNDLLSHNWMHLYWQHMLNIVCQLEATLTLMAVILSVLWRWWLGCRKGIWPVKTEWWGTGARWKWFAYVTADAAATPSSLASSKSRMVLPCWCWLTQVVLEKRLLNGDSLQEGKPPDVLPTNSALHPSWVATLSTSFSWLAKKTGISPLPSGR